MKMQDTWLRKMPRAPTLEEMDRLSPTAQIGAWQVHMALVKQAHGHNEMTVRRLKAVFKWVGIPLLGTVAVLSWVIAMMVGVR